MLDFSAFYSLFGYSTHPSLLLFVLLIFPFALVHSYSTSLILHSLFALLRIFLHALMIFALRPFQSFITDTRFSDCPTFYYSSCPSLYVPSHPSENPLPFVLFLICWEALLIFPIDFSDLWLLIFYFSDPSTSRLLTSY